MRQLFQSLEDTTKRNEKISILTQNKTDAILKRVFEAALNPYTQYYIRKIPTYTRHAETITLADFITGLDKLTKREVTGHAAINYLAILLSKLEKEDAVIAERIVKKDLRCGVNEATVNKVWENLIPTYPCLLGNGYDEKSIKHMRWPAYSQLKSDGMRVNVHCTPKGIEIFGRSGRPIDLLGYLEDTFEPYKNRNCVFDGELVVLEHDGTIMARKKGNGILNKAIKGTISEDEASRVCVYLWDWIPYGDFLKNIFEVEYHQRYETLCSIINQEKSEAFIKILSGTHKIFITENKIVHTLEEAVADFEERLSNGQEGTMLKNMHGIWEDTRSNDLIKFKSEKECDLEIVGWNYGSKGTKFEFLMGSLICRSSDGKVEVNISGFSEELRKEITKDINLWIGKIVTVKYNERIKSRHKDRAEVDSLFLPRFLEERLDKTEADHSDKIK